MQLQILSGEKTYQITYHPEQRIAELEGRSYPFDWEVLGEGEFHMRSGTTNYHIRFLEQQPDGYLLFEVNGQLYRTRVRDEKQQLLNELGFGRDPSPGEFTLTAPMPGKVLQILVDEGGEVREGDSLVILEAMKMENELRAPVSGRVTSIHCRTGTSVEKHDTLVTISTNHT
jgi:biotin carboxyl carrier protein